MEGASLPKISRWVVRYGYCSDIPFFVEQLTILRIQTALLTIENPKQCVICRGHNRLADARTQILIFGPHGIHQTTTNLIVVRTSKIVLSGSRMIDIKHRVSHFENKSFLRTRLAIKKHLLGLNWTTKKNIHSDPVKQYFSFQSGIVYSAG